MKERSRFVTTHTERKYEVGFNLWYGASTEFEIVYRLTLFLAVNIDSFRPVFLPIRVLEAPSVLPLKSWSL